MELLASQSTQGHCVFCYGYLGLGGIEHGETRGTYKWPDQWIHPEHHYKLLKVKDVIGQSGIGKIEIRCELISSSGKYVVGKYLVQQC